MLRKSLMGFHVSVSKCLFTCLERFLPSRVRQVLPGVNWDKVPNRATKNNHRRRQPSIAVWSISVLQHSTLESVRVQFTMWVCVVYYHSLNRFHPHFRSAVCVGKSDGGVTMSSFPCLQEALSTVSGEFWAVIRCHLFRYAKRDEDSSQSRYQAFAA